MKTDISFIRESIESLSPRSAFDKASRSFALDLLDQYDELCELIKKHDYENCSKIYS